MRVQEQVSRENALYAVSVILLEELTLQALHHLILFDLDQIPLEAECAQELQIEGENHFKICGGNWLVDLDLVIERDQQVCLEPNSFIWYEIQAF